MTRSETTSPWDKVEVGRRLAAFRESKGWKQTYLANLIGPPATVQKINNYEAGRDLLPVQIAGKLCALTGLDFGFLYQGNMAMLPPDLAAGIVKQLNQPIKPPRGGKLAKRA